MHLHHNSVQSEQIITMASLLLAPARFSRLCSLSRNTDVLITARWLKKSLCLSMHSRRVIPNPTTIRTLLLGSSLCPTQPCSAVLLQRRCYTPITNEEEEKERERMASLTVFQKDQELRQLNRQIARLEKLRGINTGELYTWSGRYKALARDYGMPLLAWYWAVWTCTAALCYGAITVFDIDTIALLAQFDAKTGWDLVSKVDPEMGKIGMTIIVNEALEPIRLPAVIVTVKPVMDQLYPPKY